MQSLTTKLDDFENIASVHNKVIQFLIRAFGGDVRIFGCGVKTRVARGGNLCVSWLLTQYTNI